MTFSYVKIFSVSFSTWYFVCNVIKKCSEKLIRANKELFHVHDRYNSVDIRLQFCFSKSFDSTAIPLCYLISSCRPVACGLACSVGPLSFVSCCLMMFLGFGLVMSCLVYCLAMWCRFFLFLHFFPVPSPILLKLLFVS